MISLMAGNLLLCPLIRDIDTHTPLEFGHSKFNRCYPLDQQRLFPFFARILETASWVKEKYDRITTC